MSDSSTPTTGPPGLDPVEVIRSKAYLAALLLAAILGIPISAIAYGFLALVTKIQELVFDDLPADIFTGGVPAWWPVPWLVLCGLLDRLDHPVPARQRRPLARLRISHRRRSARRQGAPRRSSSRH